MRRQLGAALICLLLLAGPGLAAKKPIAKPSAKKVIKPIAKPSAKKVNKSTINKTNAELKRLDTKIASLKARLAKAKKKQLRLDIRDKINELQAKKAKIKTDPKLKKTPPKKSLPKPIIRRATTEALVSFEAGAEEQLRVSSEAEAKPRSRFRYEVGMNYGFFAGLTSVLGEVRVPLHLILGPATVNLRLVTGLAQGREDSRRFVPVNLDLIFNFPPGWFTGVENYLGCGLNYVALTSGRQQGTVGGEVCYGVESEGFGGTVYGELGYAIVRTGFTPSYKGMTVLLGYRLTLGN